MLFYIKAKLDMNRVAELGHRILTGELDTSFIKSSYFLKEDPVIAINIWETRDKAQFESAFEHHKQYYAEIMEVSQVIPPIEAQIALSARLMNKK